MKKKLWSLLIFVPCATFLTGCGPPAAPPDEGTQKYFSGGATPEQLEDAAKQYYPPVEYDFFKDMDYQSPAYKDHKPGKIRKAVPLKLNATEAIGRNAWVLWAGGNQAFWDWLARHSYGSIDLLKLLDSNWRGKRFARAGLITEPGTRKPTDEETQKAFGIRYDRPITDKHIETSRPESERPDPRVYGYPSGVVGLRLFPNPEFDGAAKRRWDPERYYKDPTYASNPRTIRPFRVGMSCGFCHIGPHPLKPPADPEFPEWKNLSNNIGNQYMRFRTVFAGEHVPKSYLYHVLDSQLPGTIDTSLVASDNINNANTVNAFYGLPYRLERAKHNPKETVGPETLKYLRESTDETDFKNPHHVPRVLLDGSDSVGVYLALARVYLNIGTYHQQWRLLHNTTLGFRKQRPFKLKDCEEQSLYWHATELRVRPLAAYFLKATDPMRLAHADMSAELRKKHLRDDGYPWDKGYGKGRQVFAKGCIACHSSIQPGDNPEIEEKIDEVRKKLEEKGKEALPSDRRGLRLRMRDLVRLTRGDGKLPPAYAVWARAAVEVPEFWQKNYLSTDRRIPVTLTHTNSQRAMATNALHGNMWEDYASQTYKELDSVGRIKYRDPFSGAEKSFKVPSGGPGYYRVPTLITIWATAPFLHNNALGTFNNDPSVKGRMEAFDDALERLLWPEKRLKPTKQFVWHVGQEPMIVDNATEEQIRNDGGWIFRTTKESYFFIAPHDVPTLIGGFTGWSEFWVGVVPWIPSIALVFLGVVLLSSGSHSSLKRRLSARFSWVEWLLSPVRWLVVVGTAVVTVLAVFLVWRHTLLLRLLDTVTGHTIPWLFGQAILLPVVLGLGVILVFLPDRVWNGRGRKAVARWVGVLCLVAAIAVGLHFGRILSGQFSKPLSLGPIPEGVPVNVLANLDPDASYDAKAKALVALSNFVVGYAEAPEGKKPGRDEFEAEVAPYLMRASKCPDLVMDRGHDYEFIRHLSDAEKKDLILLVKSF